MNLVLHVVKVQNCLRRHLAGRPMGSQEKEGGYQEKMSPRPSGRWAQKRNPLHFLMATTMTLDSLLVCLLVVYVL